MTRKWMIHLTVRSYGHPHWWTDRHSTNIRIYLRISSTMKCFPMEIIIIYFLKIIVWEFRPPAAVSNIQYINIFSTLLISVQSYIFNCKDWCRCVILYYKQLHAFVIYFNASLKLLSKLLYNNILCCIFKTFLFCL